MTPERHETINNVLDLRQPDLTVITEQVVKERNLAAIIRTCDAVGIPKLHCVADVNNYRTYRGTSAGADKYVDVELYNNIEAPLSSFKQQGFQIVAANLTDTAIDYREIDFTRPTALIMGTELEGVTEKTARACDANIVIPMMGMVESFNVSVACAIILSEAQRQRQLAGLYNTPRLPESYRKKLFFKWSYPKLAKFCEDNNQPYPPLDSRGDLIPGTAPTKS